MKIPYAFTLFMTQFPQYDPANDDNDSLNEYYATVDKNNSQPDIRCTACHEFL